MRKGLRKQLAQGQVARARGLRKELAQELAHAKGREIYTRGSQVSKSQKPTLRKGSRKQLAQGQVARARGLRKELAQELAQAKGAENILAQAKLAQGLAQEPCASKLAQALDFLTFL